MLRLDANAVSTLFSDPQAKLELQQAVIAEVCRRMFDKYLDSDVSKMIETVFAAEKAELIAAVREDKEFRSKLEKQFNETIGKIKNGAWGNHGSVKLKPELLAQLDTIVNTKTRALIEEKGIAAEQLIERTTAAAFERVSERALSNIDARINARVDSITNAEIDRRVTERLQKALQA
jgi:hypothetical protein